MKTEYIRLNSNKALEEHLPEDFIYINIPLSLRNGDSFYWNFRRLFKSNEYRQNEFKFSENEDKVKFDSQLQYPWVLVIS